MKRLMLPMLFFLAINLGLSATGQTIQDVERQLRLLQPPLDWQTDTAGLASLPPWANECSEDNGFENCHVEDLDADGQLDLIYSGPCMPYDQTTIYMNDGDHLTLLLREAGKVVSLQRTDAGITLDIFKEACCCDHYSTLTEIRLRHPADPVIHTINYHVNTTLTLDSTFRQIKVSGILRSTPEEDNEKRIEECSDGVEVGNQLFAVRKQQEAILLHRKGEWGLVWMDKAKNESWIGWIKL